MKTRLMAMGLMIGFAAYAHDLGVPHEHDEATEGEGGAPAYDAKTPVPLAVYSDEAGVSYKLETDPAKVFATPKWTGIGEPPLSVGAANQKAIAWIKETHPEFTELSPESYMLQRIWAEGLDERWAYTVSIKVLGKLGPVTVRYQYQVGVLLDGTVIGPEEVE